MPFDDLTPWDLSCPDHLDRIREGRTLIPDLPRLNLDRKMRAVSVYRALHIPDINGQPTLGEAGAQWAEDIVGTLHGSLMDNTALGAARMIREIFLLVPKKNGKTSIAAAIMLTELLLNTRPRASFILVGATQAIADLAFEQIMGMIDADPYMCGEGAKRGRFRVTETHKLIRDRLTKATLRVRTFNAKVLTGVKPTGILLDEVHLTTTIPQAAAIITQLRGGLISQPEAFFMMISTQSDKPPAGAFKAELTKARAVRDGKDKNTPMLPILYELPPEVLVEMPQGQELWRDPKYWPLVWPNLGKSIHMERMLQEFTTEDANGSEALYTWASQHLNLQLGVKQSSTSWAGAAQWEAAGTEKNLTVKELMRRCEIIIPGLDGGGLDDLFGMSLLGREKKTGRWLHWCHAWAHEIVKQRRKEIVPSLLDFEAEKSLTFVKDLEKAFDEAVALIALIHKAQLLGQIAVDRAGIALLQSKLQAANIGKTFKVGKEEYDRLVGIPQTFMLMGPIKATEVKTENKTLLHQGTQLMAWNVGNARVVDRGNAIYIDKEVSGRSKIDALMALFNSVAIMSTNPKPATLILKDKPLETIEFF